MPHDWSRNTAQRAALQSSVEELQRRSPARMAAVVCRNEVNTRHGTGILIQRLFPDDSRVVSIRAISDWEGEQDFGALQLVIPWQAEREHIYRWTLEQTQKLDIARIVCIPFSQFELIAAMALRDALRVPLCLYIMDDQNVSVAVIPDDLMAEAIEKATVRLAISSDMRDGYMAKFGHRFWIAPPTIPPGIRPAQHEEARPGTGVIVGNVWGRSWFEALRSTIRDSGFTVDWFSNAAELTFWLDLDAEALRADGIVLHPPIPESQLAQRLGSYEFAILPTVRRDVDENRGVASLSLPSRVPFLLGGSDLPIIVVGDRQTHVARFVEHYSVGKATDYEGAALVDAVGATRQTAWKAAQARSLQSLRVILGGTDIAAWLSATIEDSRPPSMRFERLIVEPASYVPTYIDDSPTAGYWIGHFDGTLAALRRLAESGLSFDFIVDVGASTGVWSAIAGRVFPDARFILIEPLIDRHDQPSVEAALRSLGDSTVCRVAVAEESGGAALHVDHLLFGSSLIEGFSHDGTEAVTVEVTTLDQIGTTHGLRGKGMLKLDIQGGELSALRGAHELLASVEVIVIEVTLAPATDDAPDFEEVHDFLCAAGFVWYDDLESLRDPGTGTLLQKELMYIRADHRLALRRRFM